MGNFKNEAKNYECISRKAIFDNTLSDRARFVYCYMAAKPSGWDFYLVPMAKEIGYTTATLRKYINELVNSGWLEKGEQSNINGRYGATKYILKGDKSEPSNKKPYTEICDTENLRYAKSITQINKDNIYNNKDNKDIDSIYIAQNDSFETFWNAYGYKKSKETAKRAWRKLSQKEREDAIKAIPAYKADCQRCNRAMKYPATYLNGKTWEDDFSNNVNTNINGNNRKPTPIENIDAAQQRFIQELNAFLGTSEDRNGKV